MDIRPIKTEEDYWWALAEVEPYFDCVPDEGTPEADRFDVLTELISAYEARHHPIEPLSPIELIEAYMEEAGLRQSDLAAVLGSESRASEVLNLKRPLTLSAIQRIHRDWRLPASVLIQPYHLDVEVAHKRSDAGQNALVGA